MCLDPLLRMVLWSLLGIAGAPESLAALEAAARCIYRRLSGIPMSLFAAYYIYFIRCGRGVFIPSIWHV